MVVSTQTVGTRRHRGKAVYSAPKPCAECGSALPPKSSVNRILCDRCRGRRRGITFLRKASEVLGPDWPAEAGEVEVLVGKLELAR